MATLIDWLAFAGARNSSGAAVSSGAAWFFEPGGGTTAAVVYTDVDGTVIATQPVVLDAAGRATVYTIEPVRVLIEDSTGATITDEDQGNVVRAESVQVDNAGFTSGYLDGVLDALALSTGGDDGLYQESSGATARTIKAKFAEISVSVKDFGAKGDGLTVDTTGIQAAINRVAYLGGGEVYFPPGTYITDLALTCTTSGVSLRGSGRQVTKIKTNGAVNGATFTGCSGFAIRGLAFTSTGAVNSTGVALSGCGTVTLEGLSFDQFYIDVSCAATTAGLVVTNCNFTPPVAAGAAARGLKLTDTTTVLVSSCSLAMALTAGRLVEFVGACGSFTCTGSSFIALSSGVAVYFSAAMTGSGFRFSSNLFIAATNFTFADTAMPVGFYQRGNGIDGYKGTLLTGATFTPDLSRGWTFVVDCTTTGTANTVAVPTPPPSTLDYGVYIDVVYYAHAGGALTAGSGFAAGYHVSTAASLTDTNRTAFRFWWDPDASVWRDVSRSVTT